MALRYGMQIVLVLLSLGITDELILCGAPQVGHSLHQLSAKVSLEAFYLLFFSVNKTWGITRQIVESMHILSKGLGPLCESHKLSFLHAHEP